MSGLLTGLVWGYHIAGHDRDVLLAMADHAHDDGSSCYPSVPTIAWKVGVSDRTVQRIITGLVRRKVLVLVRGAAQHRAKEYRIDLGVLAAKEPLPRGDRSAAPESPGVTTEFPGVTNASPGVTPMDVTRTNDLTKRLKPTTAKPNAPAAEQGTADTNTTSKGQPKTRKTRDPGPWAAFRGQALADYGQPSTGPTQALVTRIVKTAEHHGLDPAAAARAWAEWRAETKANGTAKYAPLHLASQAWGEWIAANKTNTATIDIPRSVSIRGVRL